MKIEPGWECKDCGKDCGIDPVDYYMLTDKLWYEIYGRKRGMLCMDCVEKRLGRKLQKEDILSTPLTRHLNPYTRKVLEVEHLPFFESAAEYLLCDYIATVIIKQLCK